jgi:hypothetical protein
LLQHFLYRSYGCGGDNNAPDLQANFDSVACNPEMLKYGPI